MADDVSRMSATHVSRIVEPLSEEDVFESLEDALSSGRTVTARGTRHAMGGHSMSKDGIILDMKRVDHVVFDASSDTVRCGAGAKWSDVISLLNRYGKAPRTLQSYCTFSVGGTVSVNAHGITTDFAMAESVSSLKLLRLNGSTGARESLLLRPQDELFGMVVGGFGLFGVIYEVELRVRNNVHLWMETLHCKPADFPFVYAGVLRDPQVQMKLARIDITSFEWIALYVFRSDSNVASVSNLPIKPREMGPISALIYKWLAGPLMELRFSVERSTGSALDWAPVATANELLFESAVPMGRLYSPLLAFDDTFLLQEYFIPSSSFAHFFEELKSVVQTIRSKSQRVTLLNITIRYLIKDDISALPYAQNDSYAFVLYYRLRRTNEADEEMRGYHMTLAEAALREGGTFYLPYRHHYTDEQLRKSYPMWDAFVSKKKQFDPLGMFTNNWWDRYGSVSAREKPSQALTIAPRPSVSTHDWTKVDVHRTNSFRAVFNDQRMRKVFAEDFLEETLTLLPSKRVMAMMAECIFDTRNATDDDIYQALSQKIKAETGGAAGQFFFLLKGLKQVAIQRAELTREVTSIVGRLGLLGLLHDYASIGDQGKLCLSLRKALAMHGQTVVINDTCGGEDDIAAVLERCSLTPVGTFERVDFLNIRKREFPGLKDESFDLVTMNQGLHHLVPAQIGNFLENVYRILRPGGLFIVREHDMEDIALRPILDCAHMVFNAETGVSPLAERTEIRGFRSIREWRTIIESFGFIDCRLYELQPHDCTEDVMMCFRKRGEYAMERVLQMSALPPEQASAASRVADAVPKVALAAALGVVNNILETLPQVRKFILGFLKDFLPTIPGFTAAIETQLENVVDSWLQMLERFAPLASHAKPSESTGPGIVPDEIFLIIPVLRARAKKGGMVESIIIDLYDQIVAAASSDKAVETYKKNTGNNNNNNVNASINARDFDLEVRALVQAVPSLSDLESVIQNAGISEKAASLLIASLTDENVAKLREYILKEMDDLTWRHIKSALVLVKQNPSPLTLEQILKQGSPWNALASAVLEWDKIQLTWTQTMGLQAVGLSGLLQLWRASQERRKRENVSNAISHISKEHQALIRSGLDKLAPLQTREFRAGAARLPVLEKVLFVENAVLHAHSLTRLLSDTTTDVTLAVAEAFDPETASIDLNSVRLPTTWRAGSHTLVVTYRPLVALSDVKTENTTPLLNGLHEAGLIDREWRATNTAFTWLKLPEWMQAETIQMFGNSMNHTPFYRFPFMQYFKTYVDVLSKETKLVAHMQGWFKTLLSDAFITDFVGAVIMYFGFGALNLVSIPIQMVTGQSYPEDSLHERLLFAAPRHLKWKDVCGSTHILEASEVSPGLWSVRIPTFKGFTPALKALSRCVPCATLLTISNNTVVQVRLQTTSPASSVSHDQIVSTLLQHPGTEIAVKFAYPTVGTVQNPLQICLSVQVIHLMSFLRKCETAWPEMVSVHQVYDFFNYET